MSDNFAIEIREWLANGDGNNDHGNQQETVHDRTEQKGKNPIQEEDEGDGAIQDRNARLPRSRKLAEMVRSSRREPTTLRVPVRTAGADFLADTISATKLAVIPMTAINETACRTRQILNVTPRTPKSGPAILDEGEVWTL